VANLVPRSVCGASAVNDKIGSWVPLLDVFAPCCKLWFKLFRDIQFKNYEIACGSLSISFILTAF
jgi:hypothetical protein